MQHQLVVVAALGNDGNGGRLSGNGIGDLLKFPSGSLLSCRIVVLWYRRPCVFVHQRYRATPLRYLKCKSDWVKENFDMVDTAKPMSG